MTSDSESLVKRSEERRIIKKNEDLKKEYLMRRITIWKRHNLKDSDLWEQFREEFDEWDEAKFVIVDLKILKEFRAFLRAQNVWIMRKRDYSIVKALFEVLKNDTETLWIEEELVISLEKFNSDVIDHLRKIDFDRNLIDYSWQAQSRSRSRESLSRERSSLIKLVQSIENSLKKEKQSIKQRFSFFHSQNSQKSSSIELQSVDKWNFSEKSLFLEKSRRSTSLKSFIESSSRSISAFLILSSSSSLSSLSSFSHEACKKNRQLNHSNLNHSNRLHQSESKAIMKKSLQIWLSFIQMRRSIVTKMTRFRSNWRYFMTCAIVLMFLNQLS
jgi:hypothetical protein